MSTNDLLPGDRCQGPLDEFEAFDRLRRAVRRALDAALFQWSAAECLERFWRGETVSGIVALFAKRINERPDGESPLWPGGETLPERYAVRRFQA